MIIRINLHPAKKVKSKSNPAVGVAFACFLVAIIIIVVSVVLKNDLDSETRSLRAEEAKIQKQVNEIKARISDLAQIRTNIEELENRQRVLGRLASNRQGPQYVLNEISRLMSNPKDVVSRKLANEQGWLMAWEPENIVLKSFKDIGNGRIALEGTARSMEDIQEYWTRMKTSKMLRNIKLIEIKNSRDNVTGETTQSFLFEADANFNYRTKEGRALVEALTTEEVDKPEGADASEKP